MHEPERLTYAIGANICTNSQGIHGTSQTYFRVDHRCLASAPNLNNLQVSQTYSGHLLRREHYYFTFILMATPIYYRKQIFQCD